MRWMSPAGPGPPRDCQRAHGARAPRPQDGRWPTGRQPGPPVCSRPAAPESVNNDRRRSQSASVVGRSGRPDSTLTHLGYRRPGRDSLTGLAGERPPDLPGDPARQRLSGGSARPVDQIRWWTDPLPCLCGRVAISRSRDQRGAISDRRSRGGGPVRGGDAAESLRTGRQTGWPSCTGCVSGPYRLAGGLRWEVTGVTVKTRSTSGRAMGCGSPQSTAVT